VALRSDRASRLEVDFGNNTADTHSALSNYFAPFFQLFLRQRATLAMPIYYFFEHTHGQYNANDHNLNLCTVIRAQECS
jgi:hypothetical protein